MTGMTDGATQGGTTPGGRLILALLVAIPGLFLVFKGGGFGLALGIVLLAFSAYQLVIAAIGQAARDRA